MDANFLRDVEALYRAHGPRHMLPFIGDTFGSPSSSSARRPLRVLVTGLNAYEPENWNGPPIVPASWRSWWAAGTYAFHRLARTEAEAVARALLRSPAGSDFTYPAEGDASAFCYATNFVKIYTSADYKQSAALSEELLAGFRATWTRELDTMAKHQVFPTLIVAFGRQIWDALWQALSPHDVDTYPVYDHLSVQDYRTSGPDEHASQTYHHANRIRVVVAGTPHDVFLVRLDHPAVPKARVKTAAWLLNDAHYQDLLKA